VLHDVAPARKRYERLQQYFNDGAPHLGEQLVLAMVIE
jgi:hypothetical protein